MKRFMTTTISIFLCFLANFAYATLYDVYDEKVMGAVGDTNKLLGSGKDGILNTDLINQLEELQKEVKKVTVATNKTEVANLLNEVNALIAQASKTSDALSVNGSINSSGKFALNYHGYDAGDILNGASTYAEFYQNNANTTLKTMQNATDAIEADNNNSNNTPQKIDTVIGQATEDINGAPGPTQAIGGLAQINAQILKELQSMHTQLAAMVESQNAAAAKKIQEEATTEVGFNDIVTKDAKESVLSYGDNPLPDPAF